MINYEKQINFLTELGAKKEFFYNITLTNCRIQLQGELTAEARASMEQYVALSLDESSNWIKGDAVIHGINVSVVLTF